MLNKTYLNTALGRDDSIYRRFGEGIELAIVPSHKVRFEKVATVTVVLELSLVQLHGEVRRLEVQRDQLTSGIPENLEKKQLEKRCNQTIP